MARAQNKRAGSFQRQTKAQRSRDAEVLAVFLEPSRVVQKKAEPLQAKTEKQRKYINAIKSSKVTFGIGPAGTGKTYVAGAIACDMLLSGQVEKIIITRPAVEAGESLGFLPGELEEKYEPYIAAFRDVLNERLGKTHTEYLIKEGKIEGLPLAYMRGKTFKNCIVIFDESQNATQQQMKMFLTRIGENCKVIVDGDPAQTDISNSGLIGAIKRVQHIPDIRVVEFTRDDVVRSGLVSEIIIAYDNDPI